MVWQLVSVFSEPSSLSECRVSAKFPVGTCFVVNQVVGATSPVIRPTSPN